LRRAFLALALALPVPAASGAQSSLFDFYYQNVPLWSDASALSPGGFGDFNRLRVESRPSFGAVSFDVAYEQIFSLRESPTSGLVVGGVPGGGEWLDLQWDIAESEHVVWRHRFDRLQVGWKPTGALAIDVGRQAVSWATTLFLTPADPFSPFDPADPFREFRAGVDAARVRFYPGPLSEFDVVVRPTKTVLGDESTALGRGLTTWRGWELSGWAGILYGDVAAAGGASGALGGFALRGEGVFRERDDEVVFRGSIGIDRRFGVRGRDLVLVVEYQRDGLGSARAEDYAALLASESFLRGELQVLGRDEAALQASYRLHPLLSVSGLLLWNAGDGSALLAPSFAFSASDEATVTGGLFLGLGSSDSGNGALLASEYGFAPTTAYFSVSIFFW
jgi:hypothetical protein